MDWKTLQRTEGLFTRAVRSTWYYSLVGWVDKVKGGPGDIGPPPRSGLTGPPLRPEDTGPAPQ